MDQIDVNGKRVTAYLAEASDADAPGVLLFHAWWGLNDDVRAYADRIASAGFHVLAPDLYGGGQVVSTIEEAEKLVRAADEDAANATALAAVDELARRLGSAARLATIGFSFGAHWAIWTPAEREEVAASVVYYGTTGGPFIAQSSAPVVGHFAENDPYETLEGVADFENSLRAAGRKVTIYNYPGTGHWFAEPSRDAYRADAANLAFDRTVAFMREQLSPG